MRGRHFDYLFEDDHRAFFQKVAIANAGVVERSTPSMTKTAAAAAPKSTAFEKVAVRLERDIELLKFAGSRGLNAGMMKRADAYITALLSRLDLTADQVGEVFDKVASAAIQADLEAAHEQMCATLPVSKHGLVDDILIKIGHELVSAAMETKQALVEKLAISLGGLRNIGRAAEEGGALTRMGTKALRGDPVGLGHMPLTRAALGKAPEVAGEASKAVGDISPIHKARATAAGVAETAKGVATAPFRGAKNLVTNKVLKPVENWYRGKIESAPDRLQSALHQEKAIGAASPGLEQHYSAGKQKSLEKQLGNANATRDKMHQGEAAMNGAKPPAAAAEEKTMKAEGERQTGQAAAANAAKPPPAPKTEGEAAPKAEGAMPKPSEPPGGSEGKTSGFMDAWHKASTGGWKGLSSEEKGHLIRGGVTAALVGRAVTGHGVITGGEGLI